MDCDYKLLLLLYYTFSVQGFASVDRQHYVLIPLGRAWNIKSEATQPNKSCHGSLPASSRTRGWVVSPLAGRLRCQKPEGACPLQLQMLEPYPRQPSRKHSHHQEETNEVPQLHCLPLTRLGLMGREDLSRTETFLKQQLSSPGHFNPLHSLFWRRCYIIVLITVCDYTYYVWSEKIVIKKLWAISNHFFFLSTKPWWWGILLESAICHGANTPGSLEMHAASDLLEFSAQGNEVSVNIKRQEGQKPEETLQVLLKWMA